MNRPQSVFLGYCAKRAVECPDWLKAPAKRVCSVSTCISERPAGWIERWNFNAAGFYNDERTAREAADAGGMPDAMMFGYWMYAVQICNGEQTSISVHEFLRASQSELPVEPDDVAAWTPLGFDAVQGWPARAGSEAYAPTLASFGCSPLSCNNLAELFAVNADCLINSFEACVSAALRFEHIGSEPGPFFILEVRSRVKGR